MAWTVVVFILYMATTSAEHHGQSDTLCMIGLINRLILLFVSQCQWTEL